MRIPLILLAILAGTVLAGCSKSSAKTAMEVKAQYAAKFVEGVPFGLAGTIRAKSYDPMSYDLIGVEIEGEDSIIHAKRAQIIINPERDTMMLRLQEVVGADVEIGHLVEMEGFSTSEVDLGFDVRP